MSHVFRYRPFLLLVLIEATLSIQIFSAPLDLPPPTDSQFQQDLAWSPDGLIIAYSAADTSGKFSPDRWSVYTVSLDDASPVLLAERAVSVSWSPDGEQLAFASRADGDHEICLTTLDRERPRCLTSNDATDKAPAWSPDGGTIAFYSNRSGKAKIYTMDADGSNVRQLTSGEGDDEYPYWSPDGERIVFFRGLGDGADQIWTISSDGAHESRVTNDALNNIYPSFRGDGRVVFGSKPKDGASILVHCAVDGSDRTEIEIAPTFFGRYSPDGRRIAFISGRWPKSAIYVLDIESGEVMKLLN